MIVANVAIATAPHFFVKFVLYYTQGRINQWANRANTRRLKFWGISRLNIKILLYWFFMFLGCSLRVKNAELFDDCV